MTEQIPSPHETSSPDEGSVSVQTHLWKYAKDHESLEAASAQVRRYLMEVAALASITIHIVEARAKTLQSYEAKANKKTADGEPKYRHADREICDCVAARVIVFTKRARDDFAELLEQRCHVSERDNPGHSKHNGYDSEHVVITGIKDDAARRRYPDLTRMLQRYPGLEIQIRSVAGHAWAEYEHDSRYKPGAYQDLAAGEQDRIDQLFTEAGGLRKFMDQIFDEIDATLHPQEAPLEVDVEAGAQDLVNSAEPGGSKPLDLETLAEFLEGQYPGHKPDEDQSVLEQILKSVSDLGLTTIKELEDLLSNVEQGHVEKLMDYPNEPTRERLLDDELLATYGERWILSADTEERRTLLRLRLRRVLGKFAIYSLRQGQEEPSRPVAAARMVRNLAKLVAKERGLANAVYNGAIAMDKKSLLDSAKAREIDADGQALYVATNLSRDYAEEIMSYLIGQLDAEDYCVIRGGDVLFCSRPDQDRTVAAPITADLDQTPARPNPEAG